MPSNGRKARRHYPLANGKSSRLSAETQKRPPSPSVIDDSHGNLSSLDAVLEAIRSHQVYTSPGGSNQVSDLPKFDDVSRYGASESEEDQLWVLEAERLSLAVEDFGVPLELKSTRDEWMATRSGFEDLANIADQLLCNLRICSHDNQLVLFDNCRDLFDPKQYVRSRSLISSRYDPEPTVAHGMGARPADKPKLLAENNAETYCALVDLVTAVVARYALRGIPIQYWHTRSLCGLAKFAAKLKYLAIDPEKFAIQSLEDGQEILEKDLIREDLAMLARQSRFDIITPNGYVDPDDEKRQAAANEFQHLLRNSERGTEKVYYAEMAMISTWTYETLASVIYGLRGMELSGNSVGAFDICSLIYKSGLNQVPTLINQDRDGDICGTAVRDFVYMAREPFVMAHSAGKAIQARLRSDAVAPPGVVAEERCGSQLILEYDARDHVAASARRDFNILELDLKRIPDTVSVMVPLLCTLLITAVHLKWALEIVTTIESINATMMAMSDLPEPRYTAFASIRTSIEDALHSEHLDSDVRPLSRSLLAQSRLYTYRRRAVGHRAWTDLRQEERSQAVDESTTRLESLERTVQDWVIEESVIMVKKWTYVLIVMILCTILVIGGILVGVLLGDGLTGVDPFNITTFAWIMAGFITLVAKSLLVTDWPWRDFLRGRVPCRSISELHTVTGVAAQDIIEYLLSREAYTILVTKGPFNRPFARRSGSDGFSIDVKIELQTLVASGIIVVKVASRRGPALVCLDLRRGTPGKAAIRHSDAVTKDEIVQGCFEFPEAFDEGQEVPLQPIHPSWRWIRILGIYHQPYKLFR